MSSRLNRYFLPVVAWLIAMNALLPAVIQSFSASPLTALDSNFGHSFVVWFSLILSAVLLIRAPIPQREISTPAIILVITICLILLLPSATISWILCTFVCLIWKRECRDNRLEYATATILLAVSMREPICQLLLNLFAHQILNFDAWFCGLILKVIASDALIENNVITQKDGYSLLILTGCSALGNVSLALLLWLSTTLFIHHKITARAMIRPLIVIALVILINGIRLSLMALDAQWYDQLHEGSGAAWVEVITMLATLACVQRKSHNEKAISRSRRSSGSRYSTR